MTIEELRDIYMLKNIIRYNTRRHLKNESVAEHSFYVALISLQLCKEYNLNERITHDAVIKALLHDMPEIELNDITHDAKEKLNLRAYLKQYEDAYYDKHFPKYAALMKYEKGIASTIVDVADAMSVLQFADNELILGNVDPDMLEIKNSAKERIDTKLKKLQHQLKRKAYDESRTKSKEEESI